MVAISDGLLTAEHYRKMGKARWVFDWFVSRVTKELADGQGGYDGVVCHGKPVPINDIARHYGISHRTVQRDIQSLKNAKYIDCPDDIAGKAIPYVVKNSKKYLWQRLKDKTPELKPPPSKAAIADSDPRHHAVRALILTLYEGKFCIKCPWEGFEGKALANLLKANPSWTIPQMESMVRNRFASENNKADRPAKWIPNLQTYLPGPQDKFGNTKQGSVRAPITGGLLENFAKLNESSTKKETPNG